MLTGDIPLAITDLVPADRPQGLSDALATRGDAPALIGAVGVVTYAELDQRVAEAAATLGDGRRLTLLQVGTDIDTVVAYLACLRGRHPVLLCPEDLRAERALLGRYQADVVIRRGLDIEDRHRNSGHDLHPDLAVLLSTSGSTGSPKLVRLSATNIAANAHAIATYLGLTAADRAITTLPLHYCYGLSVLNSHLHAGASIVLSDRSVLDHGLWDEFRATGATSFAGVPHTFELLDRIGFDAIMLPTLRYVTQAGGRMARERVRRYAALGERDGWQLFVMYGQTEATARMAYLPPDMAVAHPHTIGVPIPGGSFRIADPDAHGVGELVYSGPNVMMGYAISPADLAAPAAGGELHTGDLARRTSEGLYEITGRASRFIKPFGLRIDLDALETALMRDGIGAWCAGDDEGLVVAVTSDEDRLAAELRLAAILDLPASTTSVVVVDAVPRLANGKPDYTSVRSLTTTSAPATDVHGLFRDCLGVNAVRADDTFVSLGGDSLSYVELSVALEGLIGDVPDDWQHRPIAELSARATGPAAQSATVPTDTSTLLRTVGIFMVVAGHVGLWNIAGAAHGLLVVAGYNYGRFRAGAGATLATAARVAVPSVCWIALVAAPRDGIGWPNALLVNSIVQRPQDRWGYWFVEALVHILLLLAAVLAVPGVRRLVDRHPARTALALLAAGLALRFEALPMAVGSRAEHPWQVLWLFAAGWALATATTKTHRAVVLIAAATGLAGFFDDPTRELVVLVAAAALAAAPNVRVPRGLARVISTISAASLYIYLTHYEVYPRINDHLGPVLAVIVSIVMGVCVSICVAPLIRRLERELRTAKRGPFRRACASARMRGAPARTP